MAETYSFPPDVTEIARRRKIGYALGEKIARNEGAVVSKRDALLLLDFWAGSGAKDALRLQGFKVGISEDAEGKKDS